MTNEQAIQLLHTFLSRVQITGAEAASLLELARVCERALRRPALGYPGGSEDSAAVQSPAP